MHCQWEIPNTAARATMDCLWQLLAQTTDLASRYTPKIEILLVKHNKKAQLSLTNPRDTCEKFARLT